MKGNSSLPSLAPMSCASFGFSLAGFFFLPCDGSNDQFLLDFCVVKFSFQQKDLVSMSKTPNVSYNLNM